MNRQVEIIKQNVSIQTVAAFYGLKANSKGYISCPFHKEDTPSLKLYPDSNTFYCFGCGTGGDVISLVQKIFHLNFAGALIRLDNDFHLGLTNEKPSPFSQRRALERQRAEMKQNRLESIHRICYRQAVLAFRDRWGKYLYLRPKSQNEPLNPDFVDAIHNMHYIEYWLDTYKDFEKWKEVYG